MSDAERQGQTLVLFRLAEQRYALRLEVVERVIRAVLVTPVPETPAYVLGLINVAGGLLPVISLRRCLNLPDRPVAPEDQFVIVRTAQFVVALQVDEVDRLREVPTGQTVGVSEILPENACRVRGLVKIDGEIILIYDLDQLIRPEETERILQATTGKEGGI